MPFAQLPVLGGELLSGRLQLGNVDFQLFGVVPGDLQSTTLLLGLRTRVLREKSTQVICSPKYKL